jgi:hypothetical protein
MGASDALVQAAQALGLEPEDRTRCEIWSRVMGYHRPVSSWNRGKQAEYRDRVPYQEPAT